MLLRTRLVVSVVGVNLVVLLTLYVLLQRQDAGGRRAEDLLGRVVVAASDIRAAYDPERIEGTERVRRLLRELPQLGEYFDDVLITNGLPGASFPGAVELNPLGALNRDTESFPLVEIRRGLERAVATRTVVDLAGGYCVPVRADEQVVAGAWLRLRRDLSPDAPPLSAIVLPLGIASLALGALSYLFIDRGLAHPLRDLSRAAARVAAGESDVRVPPPRGAGELTPFVDAFNAMAERVGRHASELTREVKRATEETRRRERALIASGRLAAMGTLAAGIAHEINNPLGGMQNAVRRLLADDSLEEGSRQKLYLQLVAEGLERIGRTARRVLDFSPRRVDPIPFSVLDAVEGARALVEHRTLRARIDWQVDVPPELPWLVGDRHEFQQVLLNLFLNSVDVLEEGGGSRILVRARLLPGTSAESERMEILVADNGPGLAADLAARVFDPFFSAKGRPDASGLGMFISHSIVTGLGGEIEVDSEPGEGFRTWIRMPVAPAAPDGGGESVEPDPGIP